jgi:hypothetical protein
VTAEFTLRKIACVDDVSIPDSIGPESIPAIEQQAPSNSLFTA